MRIYVVIIAVLPIAVLAQNGGGDASDDEAANYGGSTTDLYTENDAASGELSASVDFDRDRSLDSCIQSCACSCVAGSAGINVESDSGSDDESLNGYLDNCASLPDASSPDKSLPDAPSGNVYTIGVHRTVVTYADNDVVSTPIVDENQQPLTYYETVDVDSPFLINGWVWNSTNDVLTIPGNEAINACLKYEEGTWEKLAVDVILKELSPTGSCPISPGTYNMYKDYQVIETFDEMLSCNAYTALLWVVNGKGQWSFQFGYSLSVDEGSCASD